KYSALRTLNRAQDAGRKKGVPVTIKNQCVASKVVIDPKTKRVTAIEYIGYEQDGFTQATFSVTASIFVLAAHSIENAKLLLMSNAANSSDQVGRNLMDHPTMLTWG